MATVWLLVGPFCSGCDRPRHGRPKDEEEAQRILEAYFRDHEPSEIEEASA
jgi:hypothetical protein